MAGGIMCSNFPACSKMSDPGKPLDPCDKPDCPQKSKLSELFFHASPKPDACDHDFRGWRNFDDGSGGEQVCSKCGMGAMAYSLRVGP